MKTVSDDIIAEAVGVLGRGGIVVYPTETVYGIGCDPLDIHACERIRRLKKREAVKPFILIADSIETVERCAGRLDTRARTLAERFWPGPLTLVMPTEKELPDHLKGPSGGVAFRVSPHPTAAALSREFAYPVVSTSANTSGGNPVTSYEDALRLFGDRVDMVIGGVETPGNEPSTILDLTSPSPRILREGAVGGETIMEVLQHG